MWKRCLLVVVSFGCALAFGGCDVDSGPGADTTPAEDTTPDPEDTTPAPEDAVTPPEDTIPPPEDTLPPPEDTIPPPEDTLPPPEDTVLPPEDTLPPPEDTIPPPEDTLPPPEDTVLPPEDTVLPPEDTLPPPEDTIPPEDVVEVTLQWYTTCGNPVCNNGDEPPPGIPDCDNTVKEGDQCAEEGAGCDAGLGCGSYLLCAQSDPKAMGCPISKRAAKRDIRYLTPADLVRFTREVLDLRLATWSYRTDAGDAPARLGFVIDDLQPDSVAVNGAGERVDLYGYTSLTIAAVQQQARELEALRDQVEKLEARLDECRGAER